MRLPELRKDDGKTSYRARLVEELDSLLVPIYQDERGMIGGFEHFCVEGLHVVTMQPGAVRGNHVHDRDEIICVIGGGAKCEVSGADDVSGECERIIVRGNLKSYRIKTGIKHIFRNLGAEPFYLVCFYEASSGTR